MFECQFEKLTESIRKSFIL